MISFVIPALNEETLITRCISSIHKECEDWVNYEIIVVDNGSTDNTVGLALAQNALIVAEPNKGVTRARQAGLLAAHYNIVAFIDADNEIPPGWAVCAVWALHYHNAIAASGPVIYEELSIFKRIVISLFYTIAVVVHRVAPMIQGGNFILRKDRMLEAGGFNTDIDFYGEDTDTAVRLSKIGKIRFEAGMWVYSSSRRITEEGMVRIGLRYIINYAWMWLYGKPWTLKHFDHRT